MPVVNVSSADWEQLTPEAQEAINSVIGQHFQGFSVAPSADGVAANSDLSGYLADTGGDEVAESAGEVGGVMEADAGDTARKLAKLAAREACKRACTVAWEETQAACAA